MEAAIVISTHTRFILPTPILTRRVPSPVPDIRHYTISSTISRLILRARGIALLQRICSFDGLGAACLGFGRPIEGQESVGSRVGHDIRASVAEYELSPRINSKPYLERIQRQSSPSTRANPKSCEYKPAHLHHPTTTPARCTTPRPSPSSSPSSSPFPSRSPPRSRK